MIRAKEPSAIAGSASVCANMPQPSPARTAAAKPWVVHVHLLVHYPPTLAISTWTTG